MIDTHSNEEVPLRENNSETQFPAVGAPNAETLNAEIARQSGIPTFMPEPQPTNAVSTVPAPQMTNIPSFEPVRPAGPTPFSPSAEPPTYAQVSEPALVHATTPQLSSVQVEAPSSNAETSSGLQFLPIQTAAVQPGNESPQVSPESKDELPTGVELPIQAAIAIEAPIEDELQLSADAEAAITAQANQAQPAEVTTEAPSSSDLLELKDAEPESIAEDAAIPAIDTPADEDADDEDDDDESDEDGDKFAFDDDKFSYMQNRELSWLTFNERVLDQGADESVPLLERLNFISIFWSNLQEFFMVRVGSLTDLSLIEPPVKDSKTGMTPREQISAIHERCRELYPIQESYYEHVRGSLAKQGVRHLRPDDLSDEQRNYLRGFMKYNIEPFLSPQIINPTHPFPHLENGKLYILLRLDDEADEGKKKKKDKKGKKKEKGGAEGVVLGLIPLPHQCERVIKLPGRGYQFILLEHVIEMFAADVFSMYTIKHTNVICVTRNADIDANQTGDEQDEDYREHMKRLLKQRARLAPVRLECERPLSPVMEKHMLNKLGLKRSQVYDTIVPLDLSFTWGLGSRLSDSKRAKLSNPPFTPAWPSAFDRSRRIIDQVTEKEVLLSYPYESMDPFVQLLKEAAFDPTVVSIKITLYRLASQSQLAEALITAAENGKEVTALFELRARFDEFNNIEWSQRFERAGCNVIYGFRDYKVHSKICCITRRLMDGSIQHITQLGTGNYNEKTAKLYTDLSFITTDETFGRDATVFFKNMQLENVSDDYKVLCVAPLQIKPMILNNLDKQIELARQGKPCGAFLKANSITDKDVIEKIAEASQAGVNITLFIRGICCLVPQVKGLTDNVCVVSIVGRLLEHSRIYCFGTPDNCTMYLSSADLMTRNLNKRVEIAWPILNAEIRARILNYIDICLHDTAKLRELRPNKTYTPLGAFCELDEEGNPQPAFDAQSALIERAQALADDQTKMRKMLQLDLFEDLYEEGSASEPALDVDAAKPTAERSEAPKLTADDATLAFKPQTLPEGTAASEIAVAEAPAMESAAPEAPIEPAAVHEPEALQPSTVPAAVAEPETPQPTAAPTAAAEPDFSIAYSAPVSAAEPIAAQTYTAPAPAVTFGTPDPSIAPSPGSDAATSVAPPRENVSFATEAMAPVSGTPVALSPQTSNLIELPTTLDGQAAADIAVAAAPSTGAFADASAPSLPRFDELSAPAPSPFIAMSAAPSGVAGGYETAQQNIPAIQEPSLTDLTIGDILSPQNSGNAPQGAFEQPTGTEASNQPVSQAGVGSFAVNATPEYGGSFDQPLRVSLDQTQTDQPLRISFDQAESDQPIRISFDAFQGAQPAGASYGQIETAQQQNPQVASTYVPEGNNTTASGMPLSQDPGQTASFIAPQPAAQPTQSPAQPNQAAPEIQGGRSFLDEGHRELEMPQKKPGFFARFRKRK